MYQYDMSQQESSPSMVSLLATHQQLRSDGADGPMVKVQGEASGLRLVVPGFYHEKNRENLKHLRCRNWTHH